MYPRLTVAWNVAILIFCVVLLVQVLSDGSTP